MKSKRLAIATSLSVLVLAAGCAASKPAAAPEGGAAAPAGEAAPAAGKEAKAPTPPPPAGSPLAQVKEGMSDTDVRKILGEPDSSKNYMTGKQFIPYYFGTDTTRVEYIYKGKGRITFSRNQYSQGLKVIRVEYNPGI